MSETIAGPRLASKYYFSAPALAVKIMLAGNERTHLGEAAGESRRKQQEKAIYVLGKKS